MNGQISSCVGFAAFFAFCVVICGCGGSTDNPLGRQAVSGKVTLDGVPLSQGSISFEPQSASAAEAAVNAGTVVENGQYEIPAHQGLLPGTYKVSISASQQSGSTSTNPIEAMNQASQQQAATELVPEKYNVNSELSIEVKDDGPGQFDFELLTK